MIVELLLISMCQKPIIKEPVPIWFIKGEERPIEEQTTEEVYEVVEVEPIEEVTEVQNENGYTYLGYYELTAYCPTGNPCANGNYPTVGYTVACNSLALGTRIYIEGYGEYVVEDTGGMGGGVIDIFMGTYDECIQFGRQGANVYIVE